jgi:hypothetical protein
MSSSLYFALRELLYIFTVLPLVSILVLILKELPLLLFGEPIYILDRSRYLPPTPPLSSTGWGNADSTDTW